MDFILKLLKHISIGILASYICFVLSSFFFFPDITGMSFTDRLTVTPLSYLVIAAFTFVAVFDSFGRIFLLLYLIMCFVLFRFLKKLSLSVKFSIVFSIWILYGSWLVPQLT